MNTLEKMTYTNIINTGKLKEEIGEKRYIHSLGVMEEAEKLSKLYGGDISKAKIAGLLHDCGKLTDKKKAYDIINIEKLIFPNEIMDNYQLLHAYLGRYLAEKIYNIKDVEILDAICFHTTLRDAPTTLDKIIYIADAIEVNRDYDGVEELRELTYKNLDEAILYSLNSTISDLIIKDKYIGIDTLKARNYFLKLKSIDF